MEQEIKPFSMGYVLHITAKHMRKSIDVSIRKTFERLPEFQGDQAKGEEIFMTLSCLHQMRKQIDDFQAANTNKEGSNATIQIKGI